MPSMHAPNMTASNERNIIGKPENGARMTRMPRRMRVLERDICSSVSGSYDDDKFPANCVRTIIKMSYQFIGSA